MENIQERSGMKRYIFLLIFLFILISLFVSVFLVRNRLEGQTNGEEFTKIQKPFEFLITPKEDNINIVIIHLKNPGLTNDNNFSLKIFEQGALIRELNFKGENIGDPSDLKFQFEPIRNSGNVDYVIQISADDYRNPIYIYTDSEKKPFYRLYYRSSGGLTELKNWVFNWQKRILNNLTFFTAWSILLTGILYWGLKNEKN